MIYKERMEKHAKYKNEVEEPMVAPMGHLDSGMGLCEDKKQGAEIIYGQAGMAGTKSDEKKIMSQMKNYGWSGTTGSSY